MERKKEKEKESTYVLLGRRGIMERFPPLYYLLLSKGFRQIRTVFVMSLQNPVMPLIQPA